jgi:predicted DNA-binding transcriptional regulator YafY
MTSPYFTRQEAAQYLGVSIKTVDRMSTTWEAKCPPGKVRTRTIAAAGQLPKVRIPKEDVYKLLPPLKSEADKQAA